MTGTQLQTGSDPTVGTKQSATASCPTGKILLGGGGIVSTNGPAGAVALYESYPSAANTWTATGIVLGSSGNPLGSGKKLTVQAYTVCTS